MNKVYTSGVIYKWTSPVNKSYIGQTIDQKARYHDFLGSYYNYAGAKINRARKKYGPENFSYEILMEIHCNTENELLDALDYGEQYYIDKYDTIKNGYNIHRGGRKRFYHHKTTEQQRKEISKRMKDYYKTHKTATIKPVAQYNKNGDLIRCWESARQAGLTLNVQPNGITDCCRFKMKSVGNYMWRYIINGNVPTKIESFHNSRAIEQYDLDGNLVKVGDTCSIAAKAMNYCVSYFNKICNGLNDHCARGFKFYKAR